MDKVLNVVLNYFHVSTENIKIPNSMIIQIEDQILKGEKEIDEKYLAITYQNLNEEKFSKIEKNEFLNRFI